MTGVTVTLFNGKKEKEKPSLNFIPLPAGRDEDFRDGADGSVSEPNRARANFWAIWMHDVISFPVVVLSSAAVEPHTSACVCVRVHPRE